MRTRHYHVVSGLSGGYMPSDTYLADTLEEARRVAVEMANGYRDSAADDPDTRVCGSARDGYYSIIRDGCYGWGEVEHIAIETCYDADCRDSEGALYNE